MTRSIEGIAREFCTAAHPYLERHAPVGSVPCGPHLRLAREVRHMLDTQVGQAELRALVAMARDDGVTLGPIPVDVGCPGPSCSWHAVPHRHTSSGQVFMTGHVHAAGGNAT